MNLWSVEHFLTICHHFRVALLLLCCCTHPKVMTKMAKKCSTDQRFIRKRNTTYKTHTLVPQSEWLKNSWFSWLLLFFLGLWVWIPGPWIVNLVSILFSDWSMLQLYYQFAQLVYRVTPEATVMQWPFLVPKNSLVPKNGRTCCTLPNWFLEFATTSTGWPMFSVSFLTAIQRRPIGKVEKILKGSLELIPSPSPSVKIQIMAETLLEVERQNIAGWCQQTFWTPSNGLPLHLKHPSRP